MIADTLNQAVAPINDNNNSRFSHIFNVDILKDIPNERLLAIKRAMINDQESTLLRETIKNGWPDSKQQVPDLLKPYFSATDTLTHENDVILKSERIFIPQALRAENNGALAHCSYGI